jgi:hypothetical protein
MAFLRPASVMLENRSYISHLQRADVAIGVFRRNVNGKLEEFQHCIF